MPLYEWHCEACDKTFEGLSKPHDPVQCKHCRSINVVKLISAVNYKWNCDPGGSTTSKGHAHREEHRKEGKRERLTNFAANEGKWKA